MEVCLFLRYCEECHFLLTASICFCTQRLQFPERRQAEFKGRLAAGEEPVNSLGQSFDGRREETVHQSSQ